MTSKVDFCRLQRDSLQRYIDYHRLPTHLAASKNDLALQVATHFSQAGTLFDDEKATILSFLTYIREGHQTPLKKQTQKRVFPKPTSPRKKRKSMDETSLDSFSDTSSERPKKTKRKEKLYCICEGESFGEMIACDNKACTDRSNWYHMDCVGLESTPETWFCPQCQSSPRDVAMPENHFRKPALSTTYGDMISNALRSMDRAQGTFKEICEYVEAHYQSQLNWKLESDQRKSPVWKSSVRKILFSNSRFKRHPVLKGVFCLVS